MWRVCLFFIPLHSQLFSQHSIFQLNCSLLLALMALLQSTIEINPCHHCTLFNKGTAIPAMVSFSVVSCFFSTIPISSQHHVFNLIVSPAMVLLTFPQPTRGIKAQPCNPPFAICLENASTVSTPLFISPHHSKLFLTISPPIKLLSHQPRRPPPLS